MSLLFVVGAATILAPGFLLPTINYIDVLFAGVLLLSFIITYVIDTFLTCRSVYLVDFACFRPPDELKITRQEFLTLANDSGNFNPEAMAYQTTAIHASGIGDESYMPRTVFTPIHDRVVLRESRQEATLTMCGAVDDLVASTGVHLRRDVRVLVVNCGVLNTTPSLSALLINRYRLRSTVISFNLGGMGCASGVVAVELARDLILGAYRGCCALVVSTESVSSTWYAGNEVNMLGPNCSMRMGAAAVLLSSSWKDRWRSKYRLEHVERRMVTAVPDGVVEVETREDGKGNRGLRVGRDLEGVLLGVSGDALKDNYAASLRHLDSTTMPEFRLLWRFFQSNKTSKKDPDGKFSAEAVPTTAKTSSKSNKQPLFQHICVQPMSSHFLDEIQKRLDLTDEHMEASRRTLHRFGNVSSSGVWYELAFLEAASDIARGNRVWQLAVGSGFKCNSMTWKALRHIPRPSTSPWAMSTPSVNDSHVS